MNLKDVLQPAAVLANVVATDKKQLLSDLAESAARLTGLKSRDIFDALLLRERLGSTGIGRGIAVPHGRIPGLGKVVCLFARLAQPMTFDSLDGEPVDLAFVLLSPENAGADHLKALARISRLMRDPVTVQRLRANRDPEVLFSLLTEPDGQLSKAC